MLPTDEPGDSSPDLITHCIALALTDDVFEGCNLFSNLQSKELLPYSSIYVFCYNTNEGDLPILRSALQDASISPT